MKFPQGEGSAVIHRKKNRPALRDILTVSLVSFVIFIFLIWNLLNSSSTHFLVVLFFLAFYKGAISSKHFFLGLFVRSLSPQLFFLVFLFLLLLSMTAFSYVGRLFLFWVRLFHTVFLSHLPPSSFLEGLSSEQFAELESVHLLAFSGRACSLALLLLGVSFLAICRAVLIYLALFWGFVLRPFYFQWFCWFQLFKGLLFVIHLRAFSLVFFYHAFLSGSVLPSTLYSGLLCPLRMHAINSCVGDMWQRL